jgi:chromate reductase
MSSLSRTADDHTEPPIEFVEIPIVDLDHYDRDRDDRFPSSAVLLKEDIRSVDGVIICTPEYNRSIPGVLKNALDWASRPYGDNAFAGRPVGIIGASVGAQGTAMAQQHLRNVLAYLDAATMAQPEAYIHYTSDRFDERGNVVDDSTCEFLRDWLVAFTEWSALVNASRPAVGLHASG